MKLDDFVQFHNDILQFDLSLPIAVTWSPQTGLIYRQQGKVQAFPYLNNYYFPKPKLTLGVLMPIDLADLINGIELIVQDPALKSNDLNSIIENYRFKVYKLYSGLDSPQLTYDFKFVTFTNKYISYYVLYKAGLSSRILLKSIRNENRIRRNRRTEN